MFVQFLENNLISIAEAYCDIRIYKKRHRFSDAFAVRNLDRFAFLNVRRLRESSQLFDE